MKLSTASDLSRWLAFIQAQPLPLDVSCAPWKDSRSNEQNALLFGVMYPPIAAAMGYDVDDIHTFMCGTHFGWVDRKVPKTPRNPGGIESQPFRTTTRNEHGKRDVLKKKPFSEFIETVERIAAKAGVFIPLEAAA
jgi:hypothetical protein